MWDKSSVEKPAFKNVICISVFMPIRFSASVIYVYGIKSDTFEIMMRFA